MFKRLRLVAPALVCALSMSIVLFTSDASADDFADLALQERDPFERAFIDAQAAAWLPGLGTFYDNHRVSLQVGGEVGVRVLSVRDHLLYVVVGMTFSPQQLRAHLLEQRTHLYVGHAGVRYVPGVLCAGDGVGCPFVELRLGLSWETAEIEPSHEGPSGDVTVMGGIGYRLRLADHFTVGARIDVAYLDETDERQIGWITPGAFVGVTL